MRLLIGVLLLLGFLVGSPMANGSQLSDAHETSWNDTDSALAAWTVAVLLADRNQTRKIAARDDIEERNQWMGKRPDAHRVDKHFATTAFVVGIISYVLDPQNIRLFLTAFNVAESVTVMQNYRLGLRVNF